MSKRLFESSLSDIPVACHIGKFLFLLSTKLSAWFVAYIATERALIVLLPMRAKVISTQTTAIISLSVITVTMATLMSPSLWMADWSSTSRSYRPQYLKYQRKVEPIIIKLFYAYLPVVIASFFYVILLSKIIYGKVRHIQTQYHFQIDKFGKSVFIVFVAYLILTIPQSILILVRQKTVTWGFIGATLTEVVSLLRVLNYSCNFLIYWVTNRQFRFEASKLSLIWKRMCKKRRVGPIGGNLPRSLSGSSHTPQSGSDLIVNSNTTRC